MPLVLMVAANMPLGKRFPCALCLDQSSLLISAFVGPSKCSNSDIDDSSVYTFKKQLLHLGSYLIQKGLARSILMVSSRRSTSGINSSSVYVNVDDH